MPQNSLLSVCSLSKKAFTLIELLIVVLIIGILAAIAVPQYQRAVEKSRIVSDIPLIKSIFNAQNIYTMETGKTTNDDEEMAISIPYKSKILYDGERYSYDLHSGARITVGVAIIYQMPKKGVTIDFYNSSTTSSPYSGVCYSSIDNLPAEKVCKSIGTLDPDRKASNGANLYNLTIL